MKIHTNILTFQDLYAAVPRGCYLAFFTTSDRPNEPRLFVEAGSRSHERSYTVRLSGSSPYVMQGRTVENAKAATWDEWGLFIAALFKRDAAATIGNYKGVEDFIAKTTADHERNPEKYPASWLDDHCEAWNPAKHEDRGNVDCGCGWGALCDGMKFITNASDLSTL